MGSFFQPYSNNLGYSAMVRSEAEAITEPVDVTKLHVRPEPKMSDLYARGGVFDREITERIAEHIRNGQELLRLDMLKRKMAAVPESEIH
jgi:hypothetical protein